MSPRWFLVMVLASPMLLPLSRRRRSPKEKVAPGPRTSREPVVYLGQNCLLASSRHRSKP